MGIVEFLKNSSCEEIEEFCARRFGENLQFFEANYPNLFSALQQPLRDYQLYIGKEGINIIETKTIEHLRPYIIVFILILAAIFTPPDIVSQLMLFIPTWLLFEAGLIASKLIENKTKDPE